MIAAQRQAALSSRAAVSSKQLAVPRTLVIRRFREQQQGSSPVEQQQKSKTDTPLTPERLQEVYSTKPGDISPDKAEMRADLGNAATNFSQLQAFDGPIVETLNGRLAMLGVVIALIEESSSRLSLWQQVGHHPLRVLAVVAVFGVATVIPVLRGYTRKEGFANTFGGLAWIPLAENWNGRLAMLGFAGMLLQETVLHMNTLQAWGLQALH